MLSPLQQRVALLLADLPEAEGFALAGGGALIIRGAVDRDTKDLDFFVGEADAVDRLLPALEAAWSPGTSPSSSAGRPRVRPPLGDSG